VVTAKTAVEAANGNSGIPWVGGQAGGAGQPELKFTGIPGTVYLFAGELQRMYASLAVVKIFNPHGGGYGQDGTCCGTRTSPSRNSKKQSKAEDLFLR
jgi:hypothetical protein